MGAGSSQQNEALIWEEKDKYLNMNQLEKRNQYPGNFVARDKVKTWPDYFIGDIGDKERQSFGLYPPREDINQKVALWEGDITQLEVEALVNSAARPERGGQVNQVILGQAGPYYRAECLLNGLGSPGEAMVTGGYRLPAKYIINTLAPRDQDEAILRLCYTNCLDKARHLNIKTIAFPCIATKKRNGFHIDVATNLTLDTVRKWLEMYHNEIDLVIFCVYDVSSVSSYRRHMQKYFPLRGYCSTPSTYVPNEQDNDVENNDSDTSNGSDKSLSLEEWRDNIVQPGTSEITIRRGDVQKMVKQLYTIYSDTTELSSKETEITFEGEEGMDLGGLTKEYFYESLDTLAHRVTWDSPIFEGSNDHMLPCASSVHVQRNSFTVTGRLLAHSVLNYGMGLVGMSRAIVYLLSHAVSYDDVEMSGVPVTIDDVCDLEMRKLLQVPTVAQLTAEDKAKLREYMETCNVGYLKIEDGTMDFIKQELMLYEVVYRRWPQVEALRQGLEAFSLYSFLSENPTEANIREVFPLAADLVVLPYMLNAKLEWYGEEGETKAWFSRVLQDIHDNKMADVTMNTLLVFWTGEPCLPTSFLAAETDPSTTLPQASTCYNRLFIPAGCSSYEEFAKNFQTALTFGAKGFGEV